MHVPGSTTAMNVAAVLVEFTIQSNFQTGFELFASADVDAELCEVFFSGTPKLLDGDVRPMNG